jgi:hypothetical protein
MVVWIWVSQAGNDPWRREIRKGDEDDLEISSRGDSTRVTVTEGGWLGRSERCRRERKPMRSFSGLVKEDKQATITSGEIYPN